jgi:undecaprenyl-diphosphatase
MTIIEAVILGIIQGLTEFLPVSSSGHLELAKYFFGQEQLPQDSLLITVVLHAATALSTIVIFRKDIAEIFKGLFQFKWNKDTQYSLKIIVSMIPAALIGLFYNDAIEALYDGQVQLVGFMLIITGLLLFLADRAKVSEKGVSFKSSLIIGISQAIAILPGISRSGATISTAVLLGIDREKAARFSFLMVIPLILGKMAKDIMDGALVQPDTPLFALTAGFISAFIVGLFACTWMISLVKKSKLKYFAIYCFIVGLIAIFFLN